MYPRGCAAAPAGALNHRLLLLTPTLQSAFH